MAPLAVPAMLIGTGLQAYGGYQEAQQQAAVDDYNARVQELEARAVEQRSIIESRRQAQEASRKMSTLRAGLAKSGAVTTEGTPLMIQSEQAKEFDIENQMIGQEGITEAARARESAKMYKYSAKSTRRAAPITAGATLLTGFGTTFQGYGKK